MDIGRRSRVSAICLIFMLFMAFGGRSYSVEGRRPKNVQVSLRAKWPGTSLLLEAGELLSKEWKDLFWEFTELWLQPDRASDCSTARCCLEKIVNDGHSLLSDHLGSIFEFSLTLRSASPRMALYRQLAEDSLSSFPVDDEANSITAGPPSDVLKVDHSYTTNPLKSGGSCCWVDAGSMLLFNVPELLSWLDTSTDIEADSLEQPELFDFDHIYFGSHISSKVAILYGALGMQCFQEFHVVLAEASKKEDVELIAKLGFGAYRVSISWSRIFPDGFGNKVNEKGIAYYNYLIDYLLKEGIQPYVTLYHWDLPYNLHESEGGWLSERIVEYFALYVEVCFARFVDRVKHWMTINEPLQTAINGYSIGIFAPGRRDNPYKEPYLAAHYQILAHAAAVDVYRKKFKATQGGEIGLVVDCEWAEAFSDKEQDMVAVERRLDFQLGWFLDPIFYGDYPAVMRERLGDHLPQFTQRDKELLRDATDFIGLNHYTSRLIAHASGTTEGPFYEVQELERMVKWQGGELIGDRAASNWLYIVHWGFRKLLNYIAKKYKNIPIYVTENGMDDEENETATLNEFLNDEKRVKYFKGYIGAVAQAIRRQSQVF